MLTNTFNRKEDCFQMAFIFLAYSRDFSLGNK